MAMAISPSLVSNTQKISLLLWGRVSIKPALISLSIQRCFSSSLQTSSAATTTLLAEDETETTPRGGTTPLSASPWLMVPPSLVADCRQGSYKLKRDAKYCPHCKSVAVLEHVAHTVRFKVKRKSEVEPEDNDHYHFLNVAENKVLKKKKKNLWMPWQTDHLSPDEAICIGSSHGWLAYIHPRNCSLYLYNPFIDSSMPYLPLPPIETLPPVMASRRLNGIHIDSSSSSVVTEFMIWNQMLPISAKDLSENFFRKIVMSSAPTPFSSDHYQNFDQGSHCTVMAIQGNAHPQRLAFCRIGDTSWIALDSPVWDTYEDLLYFSKNKLFYALCCHGSIESWDLTNPSSPKRSLAISTGPPRVKPPMDHHQQQLRNSSPTRYLVESSGDLLMVLRYHLRGYNMTAAFDVYKRDFVENKWVYVPSLGDQVLFIGQNHSVSLSAHDFPGLGKNSIYFTAEYIDSSYGCYDLGVFNLEDDSLYRFNSKDIQPSPIWVVPQL